MSTGTAEFGGHVALVTGAAGQGIGRAIARRLAAGGATVVVTDIHAARTEKVTAEIAAEFPAATVAGYPMDAGDRDHVDHVLNEVTGSIGPVRILVNNAAMNIVGGIFDYDPTDWDRIVRLNLSAPWYLCRVAMPAMRDVGGGVVVNIGSYASDLGGLGLETPYAATKGGLAALTRALAHEGGPHQIRVNLVSMGVVTGTKFVDDNPVITQRPDAMGPLGALPDTSDIAETVAFLASRRARHITGEIVNVAAGAYMRN